jgi:hypothetical protein
MMKMKSASHPEGRQIMQTARQSVWDSRCNFRSGIAQFNKHFGWCFPSFVLISFSLDKILPWVAL